MARTLYRSLTERLLSLPDDLLLYPAHYSGSVCGRGLSANPASTIGFERRHNRALQFDSEDAFADALVKDIPRAAAAGRDPRRQPRRPLARQRTAVTRPGAGPARAPREPRAVLAAGRGQRVRGRDGRARALDPAADRREQDFGLGSSAAVLSFIVAFGLAKAFTNLGAGAFAERVGRRRLLILGWALALPCRC